MKDFLRLTTQNHQKYQMKINMILLELLKQYVKNQSLIWIISMKYQDKNQKKRGDFKVLIFLNYNNFIYFQ